MVKSEVTRDNLQEDVLCTLMGLEIFEAEGIGFRSSQYEHIECERSWAIHMT